MSNILLVSATTLEHGRTEIKGVPIHIVGIGKVEAAANLNKLLEEHTPSVVVNFGSCGNLKDHKVGELLEVGTSYNDFYAGTLHSSLPFRLSSSSIKCLTTDTFYEKGETYHHSYLHRIKGCDIVDMELYSIVYTCKLRKVPIIAYKWISDDGNPENWEEIASIGFRSFEEKFEIIMEKYGTVN